MAFSFPNSWFIVTVKPPYNLEVQKRRDLMDNNDQNAQYIVNIYFKYSFKKKKFRKKVPTAQ